MAPCIQIAGLLTRGTVLMLASRPNITLARNALPRYYLIDFGISRRYGPKDIPPLEPIIIGGDKTVPEFQNSYAPCNPFHTDICYIGNFIREGVLEVGTHHSFLY
jgi:hypothetical protein